MGERPQSALNSAETEGSKVFKGWGGYHEALEDIRREAEQWAAAWSSYCVPKCSLGERHRCLLIGTHPVTLLPSRRVWETQVLSSFMITFHRSLERLS